MQGWTQLEIASRYGLAQPRISQILQVAAGEVEEMPRDMEMRARRAQVEANISYWAEQREAATSKSAREGADKRLGFWFDFRARLNAEYAPSSVYVTGDGRPQVHYYIEPSEETEELR
jgi:transcriptional regulator with XRE-family HTH domain